MEKTIARYSVLLDECAAALDRARVWLLGKAMGVRFLRRLYGHCAWRLGLTFFILTSLYLPLALRYPDVLLAAGPFVFGYVHLLASHWLIQTESLFGERRGGQIRRFHAITVVTLLSILAREISRRYGWLPEIPLGTWDLVAATLVFLIVRGTSRAFDPVEVGVCLVVNYAVLRFAWREPLVFVGAVLILHNWIAFLYWILAARGTRRNAAILATCLFGLIHGLVAAGYLDAWFPESSGESGALGASDITGWYLASWSGDPVVWYRATVLYAYGISMHYFVWLKAIPESLSELERPGCFRRTLSELRRGVGAKTLAFTSGSFLVGTALWAVAPSFGRTVYFAVATLHGWLELVFLSSWIRIDAPKRVTPR